MYHKVDIICAESSVFRHERITAEKGNSDVIYSAVV